MSWVLGESPATATTAAAYQASFIVPVRRLQVQLLGSQSRTPAVTDTCARNQQT